MGGLEISEERILEIFFTLHLLDLIEINKSIL